MSDTQPVKVIDVQSIEHFKREDVYEEDSGTESDKHQEAANLSKQIETLQDEKSRLIEQTKTAVEEEKQAWETEKESLKQAAKEEGYNEGFEAGKQDSLNEYHHLIEKANALADSSQADYYATVEQSSTAILSLAVKSAEKIVHRTLKSHPEDFIHIVKEAIAELKKQDTISIYLAPDTYEFVLQQKDELLNVIAPDAQLTLYIRDSFSPDHCLIEHPYGQVDASVDTQLIQIRETLESVLMEEKE